VRVDRGRIVVRSAVGPEGEFMNLLHCLSWTGVVCTRMLNLGKWQQALDLEIFVRSRESGEPAPKLPARGV
jgi:hypothetical protein